MGEYPTITAKETYFRGKSAFHHDRTDVKVRLPTNKSGK